MFIIFKRRVLLATQLLGLRKADLFRLLDVKAQEEGFSLLFAFSCGLCVLF